MGRAAADSIAEDRSRDRRGMPSVSEESHGESSSGFSSNLLGVGLLSALIAVGASLSSERGSRADPDRDAIRIHETRIESVAFSPDGSTAASSSRDGSLKVWNAMTRGALIAEARGKSGYSSVAFSRDGKRLLVGGLDGRVALLNATTGADQTAFSPSSTAIRAVAYSRDGARISAAGDDGLIHTWEVASGVEDPPLRGHDGAIHAVAYSPTGDVLASAGRDRRVMLWDPASRRLIGRIEPACGPIFSIDIASDGRSLAVGGSEAIAVLEFPSGRPIFRTPLESRTTGVRFLRGCGALVSTTLDGDVALWTVAEGTSRPLGSTPSRVKALAITPDGSTVVTGADDAALRFYAAAKGP